MREWRRLCPEYPLTELQVGTAEDAAGNPLGEKLDRRVRSDPGIPSAIAYIVLEANSPRILSVVCCHIILPFPSSRSRLSNACLASVGFHR